MDSLPPPRFPERRYLDAAGIAAARPEPPPCPGHDPMARAQARMIETGQWGPLQSMGRRWNMGCVALEITQRCNLDCTLCYLSDHSEAVKDIPLDAVFERIALIHAHYGPGTEVQVTGGDPTLRDEEELVRIVARIAELGMHPNLFTNGIKATRPLLTRLARAGLRDVAFHVDTTQQRSGFETEASLDSVREQYIERARGLGIRIVFNTTVHDGNLHELPHVAGFFLRHAEEVDLASFQLQAATGRGVAGGTVGGVTIARVEELIRLGTGAPLSFLAPIAGHGDCNRHALALVADGQALDLYANAELLGVINAHTADLKFERMGAGAAMRALAWRALTRPALARALLPWAMGRLLAFRGPLWRARGRAHRLAFFLHNFMDAGSLECKRLDACIFMVATQEGPISMCLHNAKRDAFILKPLPVADGSWWDPLTGARVESAPAPREPVLTRKTARGRRRIEIRHGSPR
jgi:pyruvate-formate lyase-activating enzyme